MLPDEKTLNLVIKLRQSSKELAREAHKSKKQEALEKKKMEKEMKNGRPQLARTHAESAVRKQEEQLNYLQLSARIDAVASRIYSAAMANRLTRNMAQVNKALEGAMNATNLERVTATMDNFEKNFNNLDVIDEYTREATSSATVVGAPQDEVDRLMAQTADKVGVELNQDLQEATPVPTKVGPTEIEEQGLSERLRALRS
ncbi:hypothetical protein DM02DRAFT_585389 [Periconia macrospinosa]|uniref:Snf7-domain-containing protein n=1 Tax=Periconia macrospinosa TaxID=97972 RepID=A0A2V1E2R9_9PLEO|nr:hypothetical protein DM02DRAFT_585389 [Periconia macrospinosa]